MNVSVLNDILENILDKGEIPLKYAYLNEGAKIWAKISKKRMEAEDFTKGELTGTKRILSSYIPEMNIESVYLVDLGPGTGEPALQVARYLEETGVSLEYVPVDISPELLTMSTRLFRGEGFKVHPIHVDFDERVPVKLKEFSDRPKIMLFLGNTLGNHSNEQKILTNFREVMRFSDILIVGLYAYSPIFSRSLPEIYRTEENDEFLGHIPFDVLGIDRNAAEIRYVWNEEEKSLVAYLEITKNTEMVVLGETIPLYRGSRILLGRSTRYTPVDVAALARNTRFTVYSLTELPNDVLVTGLRIRRLF